MENGSHLEKWFTLGKIDYILKNESHLWVTLGKQSHFKKWVAIGKKRFTLRKNESHLEKWVKLGKRGTQSEKKGANESYLQN